MKREGAIKKHLDLVHLLKRNGQMSLRFYIGWGRRFHFQKKVMKNSVIFISVMSLYSPTLLYIQSHTGADKLRVDFEF